MRFASRGAGGHHAGCVYRNFVIPHIGVDAFTPAVRRGGYASISIDPQTDRRRRAGRFSSSCGPFMSFPTVSVGSELLQHAQLAYLEVRQALNEHWWCSFVCGQGSEQEIPVNDWLGKTLQISSTDEEKAEQVHFTGFILSVDLNYETSGTVSASVTAVSWSWLLDQAPHKWYYAEKRCTILPQPRRVA